MPPSTHSHPFRHTPVRHTPVWPFLQLLRPANIITAAADILAGFAAAGLSNGAVLPWLLGAGMTLYGGGVVLNDVFDAKLDASERPERPIPSGRIPCGVAAGFGVFLLVAGVAAASRASMASAILAALLAAAILAYNGWGKHRSVAGPVNMGCCRGLNLLLGVSAVPAMLAERWPLAVLPLLYIAAITAVSAGEVHGGSRRTGLGALGLLGTVGAGVFLLGYLPEFRLLAALPFLAFWGWRVLPPFWQAYRAPNPFVIRAAVRAGVLSLIVLNSVLAAGFAGPPYGLLVLTLLPISYGLARLFAVT